jgi:hypothetical protein
MHKYLGLHDEKYHRSIYKQKPVSSNLRPIFIPEIRMKCVARKERPTKAEVDFCACAVGEGAGQPF